MKALLLLLCSVSIMGQSKIEERLKEEWAIIDKGLTPHYPKAKSELLPEEEKLVDQEIKDYLKDHQKVVDKVETKVAAPQREKLAIKKKRKKRRLR